MRPIDADPIIKNLSAMKTQLGYDAIEIDGMIKALIEAERVDAAQPPNGPLTLEELREMGGEPIYLSGRHLDRYDVYCGYAISGIEQFYKAALPSDGCGNTWFAYRHKPGEGTI